MSNLPAVVMCSMWQNDAGRRIADRTEHLLAKAETYPALRWVWVVGDSTDGTALALSKLATGYDVRISDIGDSGIKGNDPSQRLRRLSKTGNEYLKWVRAEDDYLLVHESDIFSPPDLVNRLVAHAREGRCPMAAWPRIEIDKRWQFYDTWAFRKDGKCFTASPPYHPCYREDEPFTVDSFGSVFMFHAEDAEHLLMENQAVLDICQQLKDRGRELWVAPRLTVEQPRDLWAARQHGR